MCFFLFSICGRKVSWNPQWLATVELHKEAYLALSFFFLQMIHTFFLKIKNYVNCKGIISLENISNWLKANKLTLNVKISDLLLCNLSQVKSTKRLSTFLLRIKNLCKMNMLNIYVSILIAIYLGENTLKLQNSKISKGIGILRKMCKSL